MSGTRSLFHPDFAERLDTFYPDGCTVEYNAADESGTGHVLPDWQTLSTHSCAVYILGDNERRFSFATFSEATKVIALQGLVSSITTRHRVTHNNTVYEIVGVETDAFSQATYLGVRLGRFSG